MATMPVGDPTLCSNCSHARSGHLINSDDPNRPPCGRCESCPGYQPDGGYESVRIMRLEPGDVIVLTLAVELEEREAARIQNSLERKFPGHKAVVLDPGMDIRVVRPGEGGDVP